MRVVGGRLKGRTFRGPASQATRPTADRLRETLFNILAHAYGAPATGVRAIDLCAGTGALGIEALSRGAGFALFVEQDARAAALIRANLESLKLSGETRLLHRDARKIGPAPGGERYGLAFLDPPYGKGLVAPMLTALRDGRWLERDALIAIEDAAQAEVVLPEGFALSEARCIGDSQIIVAAAL